MKPALVSVIVCTCNRVAGLNRTLESVLSCRVPPELGLEVLVVDNGSDAGAQEAVQQAGQAGPNVRVVREATPGLSNARNAGVRASRGDILLFIDDDEVADPLWVENMAKPLVSGTVHGVTGTITTAPRLLRNWMTPLHREWLSETIRFGMGVPDALVGGNMAIHREVFQKVPGFDPELGAGTPLGYCEETVFSWQMREAGFRLDWARDANVVHHFSEDRLLRGSWMRMAEHRGSTLGFLTHHWHHSRVRLPAVRLARARARYLLRRTIRGKTSDSEGCAWWEIQAVRSIAMLRQFRVEMRRPPKYVRPLKQAV
jgi:glycosyltransferase involved in cell wall biosynthesis